MKHLNKYDPRIVRTDYDRKCVYVTDGAFLARVPRSAAEYGGVKVRAWVREHSDIGEDLLSSYIAALDSIESVLDVRAMSVEGVTQIDALPGKPKINAHYARLTIGDKSAPFSVGMVADLTRCGMTPDRIVEIDRAGHALLFAGTIYAVDVKGGRTTPKSGRFERAALLIAGTHRCRPSGEMVFR